MPVVGPRRVEFKPGDPVEPFVDRLSKAQLRTDEPTPMRFEFDIPGVGLLRQETTLYHPNPLRAEVSGVAPGKLLVDVSAMGAGFNGSLKVISSDSQPTIPVQLAAGESKTVEVPIKDTSWPATLMLEEAGRIAFVADARRAVPVALGGAKVALEGDAKVEASATAAAEQFEGRDALRVDYRFSPGWRYTLGSLEKPIELAGKPSTMGLWVHGDSSGGLLLMRYVDASGQTFQPEGVPITWNGWRRVTFRLRGETGGRWGGANDGVIRYPIRIEHPFVIDNPGGRGVSGTVRIADILVVSEAN